MKKIKKEMTRWGKIDEIERKLKKEYSKSLKDEDFQLIVSKLPLTEDCLMKYTTKLSECASEYKNCKECSNINECSNEVPGFVLTPDATEKGLSFSYVSCEYKNELTKKNRHKENIYYFDMPREIKEARMANIYTSDKNRVEVITWLKDFISAYKNNEQSKGLYLYGNFGSGKTYLIAAVFNELAKIGARVAIIYWPEFLRDLKASFDVDFAEKYNAIKKVPLLLIDDIGAENSTPWARDEILGPLLQHRMQEKLPTFFTSNLSLDELENHFGVANYKSEPVKAKRIIERIKQLSTEMKMVSKNNRK